MPAARPAPDAAPAQPAAAPAPPFPVAADSSSAATPAAAIAQAAATPAPATPTLAAAQDGPRPPGRLRAERQDAPPVEASSAATVATSAKAPGAAKVSAEAPTPALAAPANNAKSGDDDGARAIETSPAPFHGEARRAADNAAPLPVHRPPSIAATVAQQVIRRFEGVSSSIEVRLDPAELGRVQVKLDVGPDARVTAVVAADNPATLADLMRSARDLERALESAGLELASGGLSFDLSDRRGAGDADTDPDEAPAALRGPTTDAADGAAPAQSRPFGLEAWRGVRVDMTV
jgi:hypothetical protein